MVDKEWLEEYKDHILDLWHSEYPEEGEPYANLEEVIMEQLRNKNKGSLKNQLINFQVDETELDELDEKILATLANDHYAAKPY